MVSAHSLVEFLLDLLSNHVKQGLSFSHLAIYLNLKLVNLLFDFILEVAAVS